MQMRTIIVAALTLLFITSVGQATSIEYGASVDDYALLRIDGVLRGSYDAVPMGTLRTGVLDLAPGWHDIELIYENRYGSNRLGLWFQDELTPAGAFVALESLRSLDAAGNMIPGLRADYYTLTGDYTLTVYGEGPIDHGYAPQGPSYSAYEGIWPAMWAGIYTGWSTFEERLTGQILVPAGSAVPEPLTLAGVLLGVGGIGAYIRRRTRVAKA